MKPGIENRDKMIVSLREELMGPAPTGSEVDCGNPLIFEKREDSYGPWKQADTGEEILQSDRPTIRYGVGILYPAATAKDSYISMEEEDEATKENLINDVIESDESSVEPGWEALDSATRLTEGRNGGEVVHDDFELPEVNALRQTSMGVTFLAELDQNSELLVEVEGGRYSQLTVTVAGRPRNWWLRKPVLLRAKLIGKDLLVSQFKGTIADVEESQNTEGLDLKVEVFSRPYLGPDKDRLSGLEIRMLTVCIVNRSTVFSSEDEACLFQSWFKATVLSSDGEAKILPYPSHLSVGMSRDTEIESLALMYKDHETFGVGHGCAAHWLRLYGTSRVLSVSGEVLPECEVPSISPDLFREDKSKVEVSMAGLAGLIAGYDDFAVLNEIIELYRSWIKDKTEDVSALDPRYRDAANRHLEMCNLSLNRMESGIEFLRESDLALRAFRLANQSVLLQQIATSKKSPREYIYDSKDIRYTFTEPFYAPDPLEVPNGLGFWRPFQIAFFLISLSSIADPEHQDRERVELLWFPTGGGKTEAYLGLTSFAIFLRRLTSSEDTGVQVLMRYTLRLLTSQQFQRASSMVCAMELIRRTDEESLGTKPFGIGLWLGASTTPNTHAAAVSSLSALMNRQRYAENPFLVLQCPWCRAQMGPINSGPTKVVGYQREGKEVVLACSDKNACPFGDGLPLHIVDESIYDRRPDLVIGTVDKFATLSWRSESRYLFGIGNDGARKFSPPNLIIQDELHLISGPLGSMVGIYEGLVEHLCTDFRDDKRIRPKIISSTATIRRYTEQIKGLFGRPDNSLFPQPGLDAGDSFFSSYAKDEDNNPIAGKKYIGVYAPNLPSMQTTQVRTFASLLQGPVEFVDEEKDPWWTLMAFFNSLRELGNTLSLMQSDIQGYLRTIRNRAGIDRANLRHLNNYIELTGRLRDQEIPRALEQLGVRYADTNRRSLDACLASSIIEVGIDVERLSLMVVVGQPKTTSQYIQVTGRVGRNWTNSPGLIVTLYGVGKPRDRSHFEKFQSYHERLYANVEPTSVTPFAPPVLDRAFHACMAGFVKQYGGPDETSSPYPYPEYLLNEFRDAILERVPTVDPEELDSCIREIDRRQREWQNWGHTQWGRPSGIPQENDLMASSGTYVPPNLEGLIWLTPTSLRNVDAECEMEITRLYVKNDADV